MNKDIFKKVSNHSSSALEIRDLTPDEKKRLYALMQRNGSSASFAYDRFFKEGFAWWELVGIDNIKKNFLRHHAADLLGPDRDGDKGYAYALSLDDEPGSFYRAILQVRGLADKFKRYMHYLGMLSEATIIRRFREDDWRIYERRGIRSIIDEYCDGEKEDGGSEAGGEAAQAAREERYGVGHQPRMAAARVL